ncbi:Predicted arabinose efflux permease, MFS family [Thermoflavimicrobium dichotomicum]|uniref:Predicted arabinose efflux permease, MFS family n=1 Tax=Thermoflavimicrobium dichotomicum TaxID=46223 RepID=A0A1I3LX99_9BACL|nr:Predicted arabinose efflux permease, MFS family [Thermoflavimicrobium dichotomicum]
MEHVKAKVENGQIIAVSLLTAICLLGDSMLYLILPIYYKELGFTLFEVGLLLSINRLVRIPLGLFVGGIYRKIKIKTGLWIALFLGGFTTIGYGWAEGLIPWLTLRVLWGCSWTLLRIGGLIIVTCDSAEEKHGEGMGLYNGLYRLGSLVGILAGAVLVVSIGFQYTCYLLGGLVFFFIPWMKWIHSPQVDEEGGNNEEKFLENIRGEWLLLLTGFIISFHIQGVLNWTIGYLLTHKYTDIGMVSFGGFFLHSTILAGVLSGVRWMWEPFLALYVGRFSDHRGRKPFLLWGISLFAVAFALFSMTFSFIIWLMLCLFLLILATVLTTISDSMMADRAKRTSVNRLSTLYTSVVDIGAAFGPLWASYVLGQFKWGEWILFDGGAVILLLLACMWKTRG